jgi:hypothetical protein
MELNSCIVYSNQERGKFTPRFHRFGVKEATRRDKDGKLQKVKCNLMERWRQIRTSYTSVTSGGSGWALPSPGTSRETLRDLGYWARWAFCSTMVLGFQLAWPSLSCQTCQILADFPSLAKSLSQLDKGYYCKDLSVCLSVCLCVGQDKFTKLLKLNISTTTDQIFLKFST